VVVAVLAFDFVIAAAFALFDLLSE
jgi:hypothetical protein